MNHYHCDRCGKIITDDIKLVQLRGYWPARGAGILLPEKLKAADFCSPECFLAWMRDALTKESRG
jgi:hypothetical protein